MTGPGTRPPDPAAVLEAAGWAAPVRFEPITGGWDNWIWRFETADGRAHALRLYRTARDPSGESVALRLAAEAGLPVPRTETDGVFAGRPFFVQSWMRGQPLVTTIQAKPWRAWRAGVAFGRLQARIHCVPTTGLRATRPADITRCGDSGLAAAALAVICNETFCHFDYHPLNVLATGRGLSGLLDFTNAAVGDRRVDLGMTKARLLWGPMPPGPSRLAVGPLRRLFADGWLRGYRRAAGDWPLDPLFEALGLALYLTDVEDAVDEGRGFATRADVAAMGRTLVRLKAKAGLA